MEQAGIHSPPSSLADFQSTAEIISRSNSGYGRYGFLLPMYGNQEYEFTLIEKAAAAGGDAFFSENDMMFHFENLEPYFTTLTDMQSTEALSPDYQMATHDSALLQFAEGNIGMVLLDNLQIHKLESMDVTFSYTVTPPPTTDGNADIVQTPEGFLAVNADSVLTEHDIQRLFSSELFACLTEEEGYHTPFEGDFQSSSFALKYGFSENTADIWLFRNNIYTYRRFAVYRRILEDGAPCQKELTDLSVSLSGISAAQN